MNKNLEDAKTNRSVFPNGSSIRDQKAVSGVVRVHESVISAIIRKAACSVPGVVRLAGNMLVDNIAEFVGSRKVLDRAISIEMGDNEVAIELQIVVAFGAYIPEVARNVQKTVISEIARITGMNVPSINVIVSDVEEMPEEETDTEEKE